MFTYMQLKNVFPGGFSDMFFAQILKHNWSNHKHIYIYLTNKLVTTTQSCLGAYLYSAGTQHRNLLKLLVMTSVVISHQKIKGHMNTELKYVNKAIGNFEKDTFFFNHLATIYTRLIWFQVTTKEMCTLKWLHPFLKSQMPLVFMAVHSRYGHHYLKDISLRTSLKSLLCHTCCRTQLSWYTSTGVG